MIIQTIDGYQLEKMITNALALIQAQEKEINTLNVFPVPDGDTGTNMRRTLENGVAKTTSTENAGEYMSALSAGMLLGARGNSGVILSQFFKGMKNVLCELKEFSKEDIINSIISGYQNAYSSVANPVEGTILTVSREGIENIKSKIEKEISIDEMLQMYINEAKISLEHTPELLPVLKESGVVDSGAVGFIAIFEGMLKSLKGEKIELTSVVDVPKVSIQNNHLYNENSQFVDGYCCEFILQLMNNKDFEQDFNFNEFTENLKALGNSIVTAMEGTKVKVHIHSLKPSKILNYAERYGTFLDFKLDNMQLQHNQHDFEVQQSTKKDLAIIAVTNGSGMIKTFKELGCDAVIDGGATMNTSTQEFIETFKKINAKNIAVLPNNSNVILAAKQAGSLYDNANIIVLESKSYTEGYYAIAMDIADSNDIEKRISNMKIGIENVETLALATATKDYSYKNIHCNNGDNILMINGELAYADKDEINCVINGLSKLENIDDLETCLIFKGKDFKEENESVLYEKISEHYPLMDIEFIYGGQDIYHMIIGVS